MRMHQRKQTKLKFAILISFLSTFRHSSLTIVQTILLEENRRRLSAPPCRTVGPKCSTYKTGVKREEPWDAPVRRPDRRPITRTQINGVAPSAAQPTLCSAEWPKATPIIIIIILLFQRSLHPFPPPDRISDLREDSHCLSRTDDRSDSLNGRLRNRHLVIHALVFPRMITRAWTRDDL